MLELKLKGYPRPQMKWTKDGQAITAGDRFKFIYPDQESAALIINKVLPWKLNIHTIIVLHVLILYVFT
jgi:hypothetical protein